MKYVLLFLFYIIPHTSYAQTTSKIYGKASQLKDGTIIQLVKINPANASLPQKYTLTVKSGKFFQNVVSGYGDRFQLILNDQKAKDIFLEPGIAHISILDTTLMSLEVKSNKSAIESQAFLSKLSKLPSLINYRKASSEYISSTSNDNNLLMKMKAVNDSLQKIYIADRVKLSIEIIKQNPNSYNNSSLLNNISDELQQREVISFYNSLNLKTKNNTYGRYLKFKIDSLFIGSTAPEFKQKDTSGTEVSLTSLRGNFVILDFWASWCIPCRADNPNLVKAMQTFKDKNLKIISVSLDSDRERWIEAIHKDNLKWIHVSDLKAWENTIARKYRISAIPDNFILDPDGKIIARKIHGVDLINLLKSYLN
jgi:peroxiredoxin